MDRIADQPRGRVHERTLRPLPRYVAEHLGQVLRNRLRETLFLPLSGEMLRALEALPQDAGPRDDDPGSGEDAATGG